jgi:hypothetical protein
MQELGTRPRSFIFGNKSDLRYSARGFFQLPVGESLAKIRKIWFFFALEISTFLGPKWHSPDGSMPFHRAQKSLYFQGPTASHLVLPLSKA